MTDSSLDYEIGVICNLSYGGSTSAPPNLVEFRPTFGQPSDNFHYYSFISCSIELKLNKASWLLTTKAFNSRATNHSTVTW